MTQHEKMGGTYRQAGEYMLPNLKIAAGQDTPIGMQGCGSPVETSAKQRHRPSRQARQRHRRFLKSQHGVRYYNLLTEGKLNTYLAELDQKAEKVFESIVKSLVEKEGVTEKLKADAPMEWVRKMNNIRNRAIEIVNVELIYN